MGRLYRPHVPVEVRCRVALRQLGEMWIDEVIERNRASAKDAYIKSIAPGVPKRSLGRLLEEKLAALADLLDCDVSDLRLDHDPALATRMKRTVYKKTLYSPDANDPEHLRYRPHGPEFDGSHLIKTNVRGDHGQFPDRVLIKRERQRLNKKMKKKRGKLRSAPLRSASRWPAKGTQKFNSRSKRYEASRPIDR